MQWKQIWISKYSFYLFPIVTREIKISFRHEWNMGIKFSPWLQSSWYEKERFRIRLDVEFHTPLNYVHS